MTPRLVFRTSIGRALSFLSLLPLAACHDLGLIAAGDPPAPAEPVVEVTRRAFGDATFVTSPARASFVFGI